MSEVTATDRQTDRQTDRDVTAAQTRGAMDPGRCDCMKGQVDESVSHDYLALINDCTPLPGTDHQPPLTLAGVSVAQHHL